MRFRRRTFRGRRRRSKFQMVPLHLCPYEIDVPTGTGINCDNPVLTASELIQLRGTQGFNNASQAGIAKGVMVKGIHFTYDYQTLGHHELNAYGFFEVRTAIARLPRNPQTGVPSYLPQLFSAFEEQVTERILWRGSDMVWMFDPDNTNANAVNGPGGNSIMGFGASTARSVPGNSACLSGGNLIRVKTACKVDENEGIYFCQAWNTSFINTTFTFSATFFGTAAVHSMLT